MKNGFNKTNIYSDEHPCCCGMSTLTSCTVHTVYIYIEFYQALFFLFGLTRPLKQHISNKCFYRKFLRLLTRAVHGLCWVNIIERLQYAVIQGCLCTDEELQQISTTHCIWTDRCVLHTSSGHQTSSSSCRAAAAQEVFHNRFPPVGTTG